MTENYPDYLFEEAARREAAFKAVDKLYAENGEGLKELAKIEMEEYTDEQIKQWIEND